MGLTLAVLAWRRLAHQRGLAAALAGGLVAAVSLAAAVPLVQAVATEAGLRSTLRDLGDRSTVTVEQFNTNRPDQFEAFEADVSGRVTAAAGRHLNAGAQFANIGPLYPISLNGATLHSDVGDPQPTLAYYRDLASHVEVTAGQLPADQASAPDNRAATLSEDAARIFGLKLGDRYCVYFAPSVGTQFRGQSSPAICTLISAVWRARSPHEPFWGGSPPRLVLMLSRDDLYGAFDARAARTGVVAGRYYQPNLDTIDTAGASDLARRMNELRGYFTVQHQGFFTTALDGAITRFLERQRVASFTVQLVAAALVLVALYSVAFVAGHFLDAQARELAVLRARGWPRRRVWALLMVQLGGLTLIALPVGLVTAGIAGATLQSLGVGLNQSFPIHIDSYRVQITRSA